MSQHTETMSAILLHQHGSARGFVTQTESLLLANQERDPVIIAVLLFIILIILIMSYRINILTIKLFFVNSIDSPSI